MALIAYVSAPTLPNAVIMWSIRIRGLIGQDAKQHNSLCRNDLFLIGFSRIL